METIIVAWDQPISALLQKKLAFFSDPAAGPAFGAFGLYTTCTAQYLGDHLLFVLTSFLEKQ